MKKINLTIILLFMLVHVSTYSNSLNQGDDTLYSGVVNYKISYDFLPGILRDEERIKKQAEEAIFVFRGNQSKFVQAGQELKQERYVNGYEKTLTDVLYLYERKASKFNKPYGGIKKAFREVQIELAKTPPPEVSFTNETKVIQGLTCKKAQIKTWDEAGSEHFAEFYFYEHPNLNDLYFHTEFRSIKGLLMEYEIVSQGIIVKYVATKFKNKKKIKDSEFEIPENVEIFTLEELNNIDSRGYE